jgi:hypothetical protein
MRAKIDFRRSINLKVYFHFGSKSCSQNLLRREECIPVLDMRFSHCNCEEYVMPLSSGRSSLTV